MVADIHLIAAARPNFMKIAPLLHALRQTDWGRTMPEEINRLVTDAIADLLWTPSEDADANLRHEGVADDKIVRIGNIMIDSFEMLRQTIAACRHPEALGLKPRGFGVVTMHRPV